MTTPLVSIVIPTFNRAGLLARALDSVVAQTVDDWEIVLIDDGSTDETPQVADDYARRLGERFVYQRQDNAGCCAARNRGIDRARGRFVAFLDSDDAFAPTKLERQLELFERVPALGLVFSDYICIDLSGARIDSAIDRYFPIVRALPKEVVAPGLYVCGSDAFEALLGGYFIATIVGMVRREVLADDIRFLERPSYAHEWLFYLRVLQRAHAGFVDEPLSVHYFTGGSITRTDARRNSERLYALLSEMREALTPLRWRHRRIIERNRAGAARSLAHPAYRDGRFGEASAWFGRAFCHAPNLRNLYDALDALCQRVRRVVRRGVSAGRT